MWLATHGSARKSSTIISKNAWYLGVIVAVQARAEVQGDKGNLSSAWWEAPHRDKIYPDRTLP